MSHSLLKINDQIKNPRSKVYRRVFIKRRAQGTGLYESDWQEMTKDVIKWGSVRKEIDATRVNQFKFSNVSMTFNNEDGLFNPSSSDQSFWYGYGDQQRTLVKITAGFIYESKGADGVWTRLEVPASAYWDVAGFDSEAYWDEESIIYSGYISGDINLVGNNQINIPIVPLVECFRQYSASRISGYNNSLTASDFITLLRDQQDANGAYIFRPFFGDTTTNWEISSTTNEYSNLNTATSADLANSTVWDIIQKLSEAENFIPMVTSEGKFKFFSRDVNTASVYEFIGVGGFSTQYGRTIKKINWYGQRFSKYYSRVSVKHRSADTATSYEVEESQYLVSGNSGPWTLGERSLNIENTFIPTSTVAELIAADLFAEFSAIKNEIDFTTSFVPHLEILDRVLITYDASNIIDQNSLWDVYSWHDTAAAADPADGGLYWDDSKGDAIALVDEEFKLIAIDLNLDTCESKFIGRK